MLLLAFPLPIWHTPYTPKWACPRVKFSHVHILTSAPPPSIPGSAPRAQPPLVLYSALHVLCNLQAHRLQATSLHKDSHSAGEPYDVDQLP